MKKQKFTLFVLLLLLTWGGGSVVKAQAVGDYGLPSGGEWNTLANWKQWDGSGWNTTPTVLPTLSDNVYIPSGTTATAAVTFTQNAATITSGSKTVTLSSGGNLGYINVGMPVTGTGIAASTTVSAISGTTLTLSANATASGSNVTLTFSGATCKNLYEYGTLSNSTDALYINGTLVVGNGTNTASFTSTAQITIAGDITITNAGTLTLGGSLYCNNITVNTGGVLKSSTSYTSNKSVMLGYGGGSAQTGNFTIQNDGQFGGTATGTNDGIGVFYSEKATTITIQGTASGTSGTAYFGRMMANNGTSITSGSLTQTLNISQNITLALNSGGIAFSLQNNKDYIYSRTCNINAGYTVKFANGNCRFHANAGAPTANEGNCVYNIYGSLDLGTNNGNFSLYCTNNATATTQAVTVNVLSGGNLILPPTITMVNYNSTTASIVPQTGSTVTFGGTSAPTITLTAATNTPTLPSSYTNLTLNNTNGLTVPAAWSVSGNLTLTAGTLTNTTNNITLGNSASITVTAGSLSAAPVFGTSVDLTYNGSSAQTASFEVPSSSTVLNNLTISNANGVTFGSALTMKGNLSMTGNLNGGYGVTFSGTSQTLDAGGKTISGNLVVNSGSTVTTNASNISYIAGDMNISGTLTNGKTIYCKNITVNSGGVLNSSTTGNIVNGILVGHNGSTETTGDFTITNDGTMGSTSYAGTGSGLRFFYSSLATSLTISGTGISNVGAILPTKTTATTNFALNINKSISFCKSDAASLSLQDNGVTTGYTRTCNIAAGKTVTLGGRFHANAAAPVTNLGNMTYNINGTLDLGTNNAEFDPMCTTFAGNTQQVAVNVKNGGALLLGSTIKMHNETAGQSTTLVPESGSTVSYGGSSASSISLTSGAGATTPTLPSEYANLIINNTNGITLPASVNVNSGLTLTKGNVGSAIVMNGASAQTITRTGSSLLSSLEINNANGVTLNNNDTIGTLIIDASAVLNISFATKLTVNTAMTNNGTLNLASTSGGTATILTPASISGSGTASVNQYLSSARNWYVSSPVAGATVPAAFTCYSYDERGLNSGFTAPATAYWVSEPQGNTFAVGKGYIAFPNSAGSTLTFTGTLNSGDKNITLTRSGATKTGFNLIGNPYPCHLSWTYDFANANSALIESSIWVRTNAGTTNNSGQWSFATFNASSAEAVPSVANAGVIAPMQAFWVRAKAGGTLTLNSNLTKSHQSSNPLKVCAVANTERKRLRLQVTNGTATDEALIYFDENISNGYDAYDSPKMSNSSASIPEIFTTVNGERLVINGMNAITDNLVIPLGFTTGTNNTFTIQATEMSNLEPGTQVYLVDSENNISTELSLTSGYTFTNDVADNPTRFSLLFKAPSITTDTKLLDSKLIRVYSNENNHILIESNMKLDKATMLVYNATGQLLQSKIIDGNFAESGRSYAQGVYFVSLVNGDKKETTKIVISNN